MEFKMNQFIVWELLWGYCNFARKQLTLWELYNCTDALSDDNFKYNQYMQYVNCTIKKSDLKDLISRKSDICGKNYPCESLTMTSSCVID